MHDDAGAQACLRGDLARREKRLADARLAFNEAIAIYRDAGREADFAHALTRRAQIARDEGRFGEALTDQEAAVALFRRQPDARRLAHAVRHLGDIMADLEHYDEADVHYREMLALYERAADVEPLEVANALRSVALQAEHTGNEPEARRRWLDLRGRYAALDQVLRAATGANPGVAECDRHLAALGNDRR